MVYNCERIIAKVDATDSKFVNFEKVLERI